MACSPCLDCLVPQRSLQGLAQSFSPHCPLAASPSSQSYYCGQTAVAAPRSAAALGGRVQAGGVRAAGEAAQIGLDQGQCAATVLVVQAQSGEQGQRVAAVRRLGKGGAEPFHDVGTCTPRPRSRGRAQLRSTHGWPAVTGEDSADWGAAARECVCGTPFEAGGPCRSLVRSRSPGGLHRIASEKCRRSSNPDHTR